MSLYRWYIVCLYGLYRLCESLLLVHGKSRWIPAFFFSFILPFLRGGEIMRLSALSPDSIRYDRRESATA